MAKITQEEIYSFESLYNQENNVGLMRATFNDEDVAVIVRFRENDVGVEATPVAVLVNEVIFERLTPPEDPYVGMETESELGN